jgi:hypothetical protein
VVEGILVSCGEQLSWHGGQMGRKTNVKCLVRHGLSASRHSVE